MNPRLSLVENYAARAASATDTELISMWHTALRRVEDSGAGVAITARNFTRAEMQRRGLTI